MKRLKDSTFVSLIAIFAAFNVVCDSLLGPPLPFSGVWYSWIFISEPITGIILGPWAGFFSSFIGVMIGHFVYFRGVEEFLFTVGAPIGTIISALIFRGKWKIALIYYLTLLGAFFATPIAWQLPFWGMWDVYLAFSCLPVLAFVMRRGRNLRNNKSTSIRLLYIVALCAFIGLEADVLFRIFILIPCQTYRAFFDFDVGALQSIWVVGAVETSIKATLSTLVSMMVVPIIITAVRKMGLTLSKD